jgi:hypothetical protein
VTENTSTDGRHDFDFFHGHWKTRNRKLVDVLDRNCTTWIEFDSTLCCEPVLGGLGNVEPFSAPAMPPSGDPFDAMTLRLFDPRTGNWRIWWISARQPGLLDDNPMEGRFSGTHGEFFGVETIDGDEVRVRWDWDDLGPKGAQWEQRFSYDGGVTWHLNWSAAHIRANCDGN